MLLLSFFCVVCGVSPFDVVFVLLVGSCSLSLAVSEEVGGGVGVAQYILAGMEGKRSLMAYGLSSLGGSIASSFSLSLLLLLLVPSESESESEDELSFSDEDDSESDEELPFSSSSSSSSSEEDEEASSSSYSEVSSEEGSAMAVVYFLFWRGGGRFSCN